MIVAMDPFSPIGVLDITTLPPAESTLLGSPSIFGFEFTKITAPSVPIHVAGFELFRHSTFRTQASLETLPFSCRPFRELSFPSQKPLQRIFDFCQYLLPVSRTNSVSL